MIARETSRAIAGSDVERGMAKCWTAYDVVDAAKWIVFATVAEAAARGLILIINPSLFVWLILGDGRNRPTPRWFFVAMAVVLCRNAGIGMIGAAPAACPVVHAPESHPVSAVRALLFLQLARYN